jgi:hypothetical protein
MKKSNWRRKGRFFSVGAANFFNSDLFTQKGNIDALMLKK